MRMLIAFVLLTAGGVAVLRAFFHHDSTEDAANILALLWTKDAPIKQSRIIQSQKMRMERVTAALVRLEHLGLVRRKWDNSVCTHLVQVVKPVEDEAQ